MMGSRSGNIELNKGVNVVHFLHDLNFTRLRMWARWKDDAGATVLEERDLYLMYLVTRPQCSILRVPNQH